MDGVEVKCCDIRNPASTCVPSDRWELLTSCDTLNSSIPLKCSYQKKVGTSNSTHSSEHGWEIIERYSELGFSLDAAYGPLAANFNYKLNVSSSTGHDWSSSRSNAWYEEVTSTAEFEVPPRTKSALYQVLGTCGIYSTRSLEFKLVDEYRDSRGILHRSVKGFYSY
jgi:hypothetical protein